MKKILPIIIFNLFSILCIAEEKIVIGVSAPFLKIKDVNTIFYHSQFIFELLSNYKNEKYNLEVLNVDNDDDELVYIQKCKEESQKNKYDYLLYSVVYVIKNNLYFKVILKNPYNDIILFDRLYIKMNDNYINESLTNDSQQIILKINELNLQKVKNKKVKIIQEIKDTEVEIPDQSKHEVFIVNGFFKNNPTIMSLFSWYIGYNFTPFQYFNIEISFFLGSGYFDNEFNMKSNLFDNFFIGSYGSFHLFLPGIAEPSVGMRFEFGYLFNYNAYFSLPIDLGVKINLTKKNVLRFNSSFQYIYLNLNKLTWENNFVIGFMIGYARKI